jgi:tetratricopeptide (TPR) repeat protein
LKRNSAYLLVVIASWLTAITLSSAQSAEEIEHLINTAQQKRYNDQYLESFNIIDSALQLANHTENKALIANCLSEKGVAAMYLGRYGKALDVFQQGLLIREEFSDSAGMQESFNYIATIHHAQSDFELAKKYYEKSLELAERTRRKKKLAVLKNNLGVLSEDQGNYLKALKYHSESLSIWESLSDTAWISVSLRHIGKCYSQQSQLIQALVSYEKAHDLSEKSGSNTNVVRSAVSLGELKLKMRDYESARNWCQKSYDRSLKHNFLLGIQESVECLTTAFEGLI